MSIACFIDVYHDMDELSKNMHAYTYTHAHTHTHTRQNTTHTSKMYAVYTQDPIAEKTNPAIHSTLI